MPYKAIPYEKCLQLWIEHIDYKTNPIPGYFWGHYEQTFLFPQKYMIYDFFEKIPSLVFQRCSYSHNQYEMKYDTHLSYFSFPIVIKGTLSNCLEIAIQRKYIHNTYFYWNSPPIPDKHVEDILFEHISLGFSSNRNSLPVTNCHILTL